MTKRRTGRSIDLDETHSSQYVVAISYTGLNLTAKLLIWLKAFLLVWMAAIPQGAFAAHKVRQACEARKTWKHGSQMNDQPLVENVIHRAEAGIQQIMQYSSKMMNSIWGQYNRYSVHNLKKNTDGLNSALLEQQRYNSWQIVERYAPTYQVVTVRITDLDH